MGVIDKVRDAMGDDCQPVRFSFWSDEAAVYLWENEVGISIFPSNGKYGSVIFDTEGYDFKLDVGQMQVLASVMEVLSENMDELKLYTKNL